MSDGPITKFLQAANKHDPVPDLEELDERPVYFDIDPEAEGVATLIAMLQGKPWAGRQE